MKDKIILSILRSSISLIPDRKFFCNLYVILWKAFLMNRLDLIIIHE